MTTLTKIVTAAIAQSRTIKANPGKVSRNPKTDRAQCGSGSCDDKIER